VDPGPQNQSKLEIGKQSKLMQKMHKLSIDGWFVRTYNYLKIFG